MLQRVATNEGKNWSKLILYLQFAYRQVPQAFTAFASLKLLYGRAMMGPLAGDPEGVLGDQFQEQWE